MLALFTGISAWFAPGAFANTTFTVSVIPDTQFYVDSGNTLTTSPAYTQPNADDTAKYFQAETQWLVSNQATLNLVFVTHVGDVVQNGDGTSDGTTPLSRMGSYRRVGPGLLCHADSGELEHTLRYGSGQP